MMQARQQPSFSQSVDNIMTMPARLDSMSAEAVENDAHQFLMGGVQQLALDFMDTHYMSSAGLHVLLTIAKSLQQVQANLAVRNLSGQPRDMFETCVFDQMFPPSQDHVAEEALAA
jgi:anti-anti-sigma factor